MPYMQCSPKQNPGQLAGIFDDVEQAVADTVKKIAATTTISVGGGRGIQVTRQPATPTVPVTPGVVAGLSIGTIALIGLGLLLGMKAMKGSK